MNVLIHTKVDAEEQSAVFTVRELLFLSPGRQNMLVLIEGPSHYSDVDDLVRHINFSRDWMK